MKKIEIDLHSKKLLDRGYVRRLAPDVTGGYVASIQEFPGCVAEGETADEALKNLDNAAEAWIEVAVANGQHIREPVDFDGCSGKIALRMPRTLHKQAAELAELEGCSLNQLLVTAIAHYVGGKQLASRIEAMIQPILVTNNISNVSLTVSLTTAEKPSKIIQGTKLEQYDTSKQMMNLKINPLKGVNVYG